jgi:hypothetical protein
VRACRGPPGGVRGGRRARLAEGGAGVAVLPWVFLGLGLLWLRLVAAGVVAALTPGLAVLFPLARATRWG